MCCEQVIMFVSQKVKSHFFWLSIRRTALWGTHKVLASTKSILGRVNILLLFLPVKSEFLFDLLNELIQAKLKQQTSKIKRIWLVCQKDANAHLAFGWHSKDSNMHIYQLKENCWKVNFVTMDKRNYAAEYFFCLRVFFGGKTLSPRFDYRLIKQNNDPFFKVKRKILFYMYVICDQ